MDEGTTCYITLSELEEATNNFSKKIGQGSFGSVYYGKMRDGKEVAVKTMTDSSSHGNRQFVNEVDFKFIPLAFSYLKSDGEQVLLRINFYLQKCNSTKRIVFPEFH